MIDEKEIQEIQIQLEERGCCPLGAVCFVEGKDTPFNPTVQYAQTNIEHNPMSYILEDIIREWDFKYFTTNFITVYPHRKNSIRTAESIGLLDKIREGIKKINPLTLGEIYS